LTLAADISRYPTKTAASTSFLTAKIYNYQELRRYLIGHGHIFKRPKPDTETIVPSMSSWARPALKKLRGMFRFSHLGRSQRITFLSRP